MFAYHIIPSEMVGDVLYPLNVLKEKHAAIAKIHAEKYVWRQEIMHRKLPVLNCLWNDVLHLSTIHPRKIFEALGKLRPPQLKSREIVAIPIEALVENKCLYFLPSPKEREKISDVHRDEIEDFLLTKYREAEEVSLEQIEIWKENLVKNEPLLLFSRTKHLLYAGNIEIKHFQRESVQY